MTKKHYPQLDIVKYIAALLVICAHVYKIFENPVLNYTVVSVFARLAVPFFFSSAAYMVACKRHNPGYIKRYLVNLTLTYLIFSLLYLPFGIRFVFETVGTAWWLVPLTFLGGFFYAGTYYHLWFIPGIITALLLMEWLLKRFSLKTIFWIATGLYLIGSYETYYYVWANPILQSGFDALLSLFVTTRNGLFLGLFFVWVGYAIALHPKKIKGYWVLAALALYLFEAYWMMPKDTLDFNFLLSVLPFSYLFLQWLVAYQPKHHYQTLRLRKWSIDYYYWHILALELILALNVTQNGVVILLFTIALTHLLSITMERLGWIRKLEHAMFAQLKKWDNKDKNTII